MMSRIAESLYWTGRYCARIENHARLLNVSFHTYQEWAGKPADRAILWKRLIATMGQTNAFQARSDVYDDASVLSFMVLDRSNENSIISCLSLARNNVRSVRERIPSRLWETMNDFYLWMQEQDIQSILAESPYLFFQRIANHVALFQGLAYSSMLREAEWNFICSGLHLERGDSTIRLLQMLNHSLNDFTEEKSNISPYRLITSFLKAADAFKAFRKFHDDDFTLTTVAEFLLFNPILPRSVLFSYRELEKQIGLLQSGERSGAISTTQKLLRKIHKDIARLEPDVFREQDITIELGRLLLSYNQLAEEILDTFFRERNA